MRRSVVMMCLAWLLYAFASAAWSDDGRTLYWRSLAVQARLDADGRLHVVETQAMVFDGAWNGGERRFRVGRGQALQLTGVFEIDPVSGARQALHEGSLDAVGEYRWFDDNTLRWRSRLPSDPPFQQALRVYELDYTLSHIVEHRDVTYVLDHDFAFPDRSGMILEFDATLQLDPVWQPAQPYEAHMHRSPLPPGEGVVQRIPMSYAGAGAPSAVREHSWLDGPPTQQFVTGLLAVLIAVAVLCVAHTALREHQRGRLQPGVAAAGIDHAWLEAHVFKHPPEVIGAAWDRETSTHEVAAILARMNVEKKIESRVHTSGWWIFKNHGLSMRLLVDRERLSGAERKLVNKLFFAGSTTDTDRIRNHYKQSGFTPSSVISGDVEHAVNRLLGPQQSLPFMLRLLTVALLIAGIALFVVGAVRRDDGQLPLFPLLLPLIPIWIVGAVCASRYRRLPLASPGLALVAVLAIVAALVTAVVLMRDPALGFTALQCLAAALIVTALLNSLHNASLCRETPQAVALRRELGSARRYFAQQLKAASPQLRDEWLPYLLGFGLGPAVDRWFNVNAVTPTSHSTFASSGSVSSSSTSSSAWTGGGGAFGGAGASASWVAAVGGIAAGVAAPSSSSSGGGSSSSSGGSSGGGGGGGW